MRQEIGRNLREGKRQSDVAKVHNPFDSLQKISIGRNVRGDISEGETILWGHVTAYICDFDNGAFYDAI